MQVKVFEGFSNSEILKRIKSEFGPDAVILSTHEKPIKGSKQKMLEIRAATGESKNVTRSGAITSPDPNWERLSQNIKQLQSQQVDRQQLLRLEIGLKELKTICSEILRVNQQHDNNKDKLNPNLESIYQQLKLVGLADEQAITLIRKLPQDKNYPLEHYRNQLIQEMYHSVKIFPLLKKATVPLHVHIFIGPSGAGKTATTAKIAAHLHNKLKLKVLLLSYIGTRVGSSAVLDTYGKILGIPHKVVEEKSDLNRFFLQQSQEHKKEIILLDTPGGINESQDLELLRKIDCTHDTHLVLSLTEEEAFLERSIKHFSNLGLSSMIFTKLDEVWTYGKIYNLSKRWSLPLSYFMTGPRIPQDLEAASRERVVERIIGI